MPIEVKFGDNYMLDANSAFLDFVRKTEDLVYEKVNVSERKLADEPLLNGVPYKTYRNSTDVEFRRKKGTFFTTGKMAAKVANQLASLMTVDSKVMDPTCGIGDLLLAYARTLPIENSLEKTLKFWGECLAGMDIDSSLVRLTKARLIMLARIRGLFDEKIDDPASYFPRIRCANMFESKELISMMDGFLFNPPFGMIEAPKDCSWSSGSINAAAEYLEKLVDMKSSTAPVSAVLPEVLRCGTRYSSFRGHLETQLIAGEFISLGRFDPWTDVDVFTTILIKQDGGELWQPKSHFKVKNKIGDFFDVKVGAVVPHRHKNKGPWNKYICAKTTPRWASAFTPNRNRRFHGTTFTPPFVVVRRTSSPSDKQRAVATLVLGEHSVAVENHLIVLLPKADGYGRCLELMKVLKNPATSDYLNESIRCRHLTTSIVSSIPWWTLP